MPTSSDSRNKSFFVPRYFPFTQNQYGIGYNLQQPLTTNKSALESRTHPSYQINNDSGNDMVQQNQKFTVQFYMNMNWYSGNVLRTLVKQRETLTP